MNYRHAYHAGNHADVLKHVVLLGLIEALKRKETPFFVLDTHAGRGSYALDSVHAGKTNEARDGIGRLVDVRSPPPLKRYLDAVRAQDTSGRGMVYPGSPLLAAAAMRAQDRMACCELQPDEAEPLRTLFRGDARVGVHERDGYGAMAALLPPKEKRGLVLIDPPYEAQLGEFDTAFAALRDALQRWPGGIYALWYPIKTRRALQPMYRRAAHLDAKSLLIAELMVRPDDSPLRMNGSGMLIVNPPWQYEQELQASLPKLAQLLGDAGASWRLDWLKQAA